MFSSAEADKVQAVSGSEEKSVIKEALLEDADNINMFSPIPRIILTKWS